MKPYKIEIYLYADDGQDAKDAELAAYEFVIGNYNRGTLVTAKKFTEVIRKYKDNPFVTNFLRK